MPKVVISAVLPLVTVVAVAARQGGYFPPAWGWSALALLWLTATALLVRSWMTFSPLETTMLIGLTMLFFWISLSMIWSRSPSQSVLESERMLVYVAALSAVLLIVSARSLPQLLAGVQAGIALVSAYGLATRLFPDRLGVYDPIAGYRLSEPLGYWNALGIFAALGVLLGLGFSAKSRNPVTQAAAAATLPLLVTTLYFTFSRGAWIALAVGLFSAIAIEPRRLRLVTTFIVLSPIAAVCIWVASHSRALTHQQFALAQAVHDGHRLAALVAISAAASSAVVLALRLAEQRVAVPRALRVVYAGALLVLLAGLLVFIFARYGGPQTLATRATNAFNAPSPQINGDLNKRLFNFSGSGRLQTWRVAWRDFEDHLWLGSGAGSYEQYWLEHRHIAAKVRDAHNLYLETLAELGPFGLILLLATLAAPLLAAVSARGQPLAPVAFGAYVAYLVHAGVDWDWEMPAVTVAALFCGAALLLAARERRVSREVPPGLRAGALAVTVVLGGFALVGLLGNSAIAASQGAATADNVRKAEAKARTAMRWAPWSSEPWALLGEAQLEQGDFRAARESLRTAISKQPLDWSLWFDLALASRGSAQRRALAEATRLNPLSPELAQYRGSAAGK